MMSISLCLVNEEGRVVSVESSVLREDMEATILYQDVLIAMLKKEQEVDVLTNASKLS